jgi:hypothetical protein
MRAFEHRRLMIWQQGLLPGSAEAYAAATAFVVTASLIRWALGFISPDIFIFAGFYPAVLFATYIGGARVGWTLPDARLNLEWRENGGPPVIAPTHRGFGSRLFLRALDQFNGKVEADFAATGLICKLSVGLPEPAPTVVPEPARTMPQVLAAD